MRQEEEALLKKQMNAKKAKEEAQRLHKVKINKDMPVEISVIFWELNPEIVGGFLSE